MADDLNGKRVVEDVALENNWSVLTSNESLKRCLELLQSTKAPHP